MPAGRTPIARFAGYGVAADGQDLAPRVIQKREVHIRDERMGEVRDLGEARRHRRRHSALAPRARVPQTGDELTGPHRASSRAPLA